jgi:hypothetical protein
MPGGRSKNAPTLVTALYQCPKKDFWMLRSIVFAAAALTLSFPAAASAFVAEASDSVESGEKTVPQIAAEVATLRTRLEAETAVLQPGPWPSRQQTLADLLNSAAISGWTICLNRATEPHQSSARSEAALATENLADAALTQCAGLQEEVRRSFEMMLASLGVGDAERRGMAGEQMAEIEALFRNGLADRMKRAGLVLDRAG